jgi:hypothetical protein
MKRYELVPDELIQPLKFDTCAFRTAIEHYEKIPGVSFVDDLTDYLANGFVVSRPTVFAMAKPIERESKRGWFIRFACGNMAELLTCLPCPLEFVAFFRDKDKVPRMRICGWDTFIRIAIMKARIG